MCVCMKVMPGYQWCQRMYEGRVRALEALQGSCQGTGGCAIPNAPTAPPQPRCQRATTGRDHATTMHTHLPLCCSLGGADTKEDEAAPFHPHAARHYRIHVPHGYHRVALRYRRAVVRDPNPRDLQHVALCHKRIVVDALLQQLFSLAGLRRCTTFRKRRITLSRVHRN